MHISALAIAPDGAPIYVKRTTMERLTHQLFGRKRRKASLSSFIITVGSVDAVMGLVSMKESLLLLGLGMVGVAIALRWLTPRQVRMPLNTSPDQRPIYYLPEQGTRPTLSDLGGSHKIP